MNLSRSSSARRLSNWLCCLLLLALALAGCEQYTSRTTFQSIQRATGEVVATAGPPPAGGASDVIILSIDENGYAHLFAYFPEHANLRRLTSGQWSDVTPSLSPDGKSIAFASDRGGHWDIYLMDLATAHVTQVTNTPDYDSSPTWSPDSAWMAYETYQSGHLDIEIRSLTAAGQAPVLLTNDAAADYSPAWSSNGREIAFVSNRTGDADIWLADLNKTEDRFTDVSNTPQAEESHPAWSPDGMHLAWAAAVPSPEYDGIYVRDPTQPQRSPAWIGDGTWPAWSADGRNFVTAVAAPNQELLGAYTIGGQPLLLPRPLPGHVRGLLWAKIALPDPPAAAYQTAAANTPEALSALPITPIPGIPSQRWYVVPVPSLQAPYPQLHALVAQSFSDLRRRVITDAGWDALASLGNAYVPLTTALDPGLNEDWLYTGRAFAINPLMVNAGWMSVQREDIGSQTFWRLYLRAQHQDGSEGAPIAAPPWDLNSRYELDPKAYEAGGAYASVPPGYWIDFTSLAAAYGWQRLPALPDWRSYYPGARFTEFALSGGLDWRSAMLQLYPAEALVTPTQVLPPTATPSRTPVPSETPTPSRTPGPSPTATAPFTATGSSTTHPPTSTPPTITATLPRPTP